MFGYTVCQKSTLTAAKAKIKELRAGIEKLSEEKKALAYKLELNEIEKKALKEKLEKIKVYRDEKTGRLVSLKN